MKQYLILLGVALVIWWLFFRSKPDPVNERKMYMDEDAKFCESTKSECQDFINRHVSFEGGPEAFKKLHDHILHHYDQIVAGLFNRKEKFKPNDMKKYISDMNEVPTMFVDEMSQMYKKYTIPESIRTKHMNMINSQHERRLQKENKWYKIMEPYMSK
jgi:hypothetical protein